MTISVYDTNLNRTGLIYNWLSLERTEEYNSNGSFTLEVTATSGNISLFKLWHYVEIEGSRNPAVIVSVQIKNNRLTVIGFSATYIFTKRAATTVVSNQNAETAMRALVSGMSAYPCVALGDFAGLTDVYKAQISDKQISAYLESIAGECDIGYRLRRSGNSLLFECYKPGVNANVKLSSRYGNLGDAEYTASDVAAYNVAIVAGAGEGAQRVTVTTYAGTEEPTGAYRHELYVDARDVQKESGETDAQYAARLAARGLEKLVSAAESVDFTVDDDRVQLGDIVKVLLPEFGLSLLTRVVGISLKNQNNKTTRSLTVGTPIKITRR